MISLIKTFLILVISPRNPHKTEDAANKLNYKIQKNNLIKLVVRKTSSKVNGSKMNF